MIERGECDFVTDVAAQLPLAVIAEMIGVPPDERQQVFDWSNRLIGFDDPEYMTTPEQGRLAATEMFMYANQMALDRRQHPRDDLRDGRPLVVHRHHHREQRVGEDAFESGHQRDSARSP